MYADLLKEMFMKFINWEQRKGNFNVLTIYYTSVIIS